ncbi:MAG: AEC family transporter [Pseudomonadota bacterium]
MTLALTVLQIVAPVFVLAAIGFAWVKAGYAYDTAFVTRLAMTLAVPALIFSALADTALDPAAVARVAWATLLAYGAVLGAFWGICAVLRLDARTYVAPLTFGNTGNLGLPLALFAFGETGLALAVVVFAVMAILAFTVGLWIVAGGGNPMLALKEPMVGATLLGGVFLWQDWPVPDVAMNAIALVGEMAIPLMLITLGVAVARLRPGRVGLVVALSVLKAAISAFIGYGVGLWLDLGPVALGVLVVQLATPVAVTSYLLAEKYGADAEAVAGLVVVSTVLSVAILPIVLAFFV